MGLSTGWLDMTSDAHPVTRSVYVVVLRKDLPSPLAPESDEEKPEAKEDERPPTPARTAKKTKPKKESQESGSRQGAIDFDGLSQRVLALPIPAQNYQGLVAGKEGVLYLRGRSRWTGSTARPPLRPDGLT